MMLYSSGSIVARSASDRFLAWRTTRLKALPHSPLVTCTANKLEQLKQSRHALLIGPSVLHATHLKRGRVCQNWPTKVGSRGSSEKTGACVAHTLSITCALSVATGCSTVLHIPLW